MNGQQFPSGPDVTELTVFLDVPSADPPLADRKRPGQP